MHITALRRASHRATKLSQRPQLPALIPPISLYRRILRAHRHHLPPEQRLLGDEYVKSEFRLHRDTDNPAFIVGFLTEWQGYVTHLEGGTWKDERLDEGRLEKMSDEQLQQLWEMKMAVERGHGSEGEGGGEDGKK